MAGVQIKFAVPEFPPFRNGMDAFDRDRYGKYMSAFMSYSTNVVEAQLRAVRLCVEHGGFSGQKAEIGALVEDLRGLVERTANQSAMYVADEVRELMGNVENMVTKCEEVAGKVDSSVQKEERGVEPVPCLVHGPVGTSKLPRGPKFERNQAARERKKKLKKQKAHERAVLRQGGEVPGFASRETLEQRRVAENLRAVAVAEAETAEIRRKMEDGTFDKQHVAYNKLLDGQLEGVYALAPPPRVAGWAKTLRSASTGSWAKTVKTGSGKTGSSSASWRSAETPPVDSELEKKLRLAEEKVRELESMLAKEREAVVVEEVSSGSGGISQQAEEDEREKVRAALRQREEEKKKKAAVRDDYEKFYDY